MGEATEVDYVGIIRQFRDSDADPTTALGRRMLRGIGGPLTWTELLPPAPAKKKTAKKK